MRHWRWGILVAPAVLTAGALVFHGGAPAAAQAPSPTASATAVASPASGPSVPSLPATTATQPSPTPRGGGPTPPNRFYGSVSVSGGVAAPSVTALVRGAACGTGAVTGGTYVVDVASAYTQPGCGNDGDPVTFAVGTAPASQTGIFQTGAFTALNLTAQPATPTAAPTTPPTPVRTATAAPTTAATPARTATAAATPARTATAAPARTATAAATPARTATAAPARTATPAPRTPTAAPASQRPGGAPQAQAPRGGASGGGTAARPAGGGATTGGGAATGTVPTLPRTGVATADTRSPLWLVLALLGALGFGGAAVTRRR